MDYPGKCDKRLPSLIIHFRSDVWALSFADLYFQLWVMNCNVNLNKYQWSKYIWQVDRDWIKIFFLMSVNLFGCPVPGSHHIPAPAYDSSSCKKITTSFRASVSLSSRWAETRTVLKHISRNCIKYFACFHFAFSSLMLLFNFMTIKWMHFIIQLISTTTVF